MIQPDNAMKRLWIGNVLSTLEVLLLECCAAEVQSGCASRLCVADDWSLADLRSI